MRSLHGVEEDIDNIYTPLDEANEEIWKRWGDLKLRQKVSDFLKGDIPDFLKEEPRAYIAKHVASPNFNFLEYWKSVERISLKPAIPEYGMDRFVSKNKDKHHLGKLFFYEGQSKNGEVRVSTKSIIDFNKGDGKRFHELRTVWGEDFMEFHHRSLDFLVPGASRFIYNVSDWIARNGSVPEKFYLNFFALFVCNGILFENFLRRDEYRLFSQNVVIPDFKKVSEFFGVKPLVVATVPIEIEDAAYLWYYPERMKSLL